MTSGTALEVAAEPRGSARERLLAAADELFYAEGIRSVGIDRIIERAGVAKASLYNTFGSKEALIQAYLDSRGARVRDRIERYLAKYDTPRAKILGVFESQAEYFDNPAYRGCAFINASAETHAGSAIEAASDRYRAALRERFVELAREAGVRDPEAFGAQLLLVYDGAAMCRRMDRNSEAAELARSTAEALLDAAGI